MRMGECDRVKENSRERSENSSVSFSRLIRHGLSKRKKFFCFFFFKKRNAMEKN